MPQSLQVQVAHHAAASTAARDIGAALAALGCQAEFHSIAARASTRGIDLNATPRLLVLWSRDAAKAPALRALAKRAHADGKLTLVRLDSSLPPAQLGPGVRAPRGRAAAAAWRRLLEQPDLTIDDHTPRTSRLSALLALIVMCAVTAGAAYFVNAPFAARIDSILQDVQSRAHDLLGD